MNMINKKIDVLQTEANDSSVASCTVSSNGGVKCTNVVYNNPKVWKFSQNRVEKQILSLQARLEKLKEIQKHLETRRPDFQDDDNDDDDNDDDDGENNDDRVDRDEEDSVINLLTDFGQTQFHHRSVKNV